MLTMQIGASGSFAACCSFAASRSLSASRSISVCAGLLLTTAALLLAPTTAQGQERVYGNTGRPYGVTQSAYQYERQYGRAYPGTNGFSPAQANGVGSTHTWVNAPWSSGGGWNSGGFRPAPVYHDLPRYGFPGYGGGGYGYGPHWGYGAPLPNYGSADAFINPYAHSAVAAPGFFYGNVYPGFAGYYGHGGPAGFGPWSGGLAPGVSLNVWAPAAVTSPGPIYQTYPQLPQLQPLPQQPVFSTLSPLDGALENGSGLDAPEPLAKRIDPAQKPVRYSTPEAQLKSLRWQANGDIHMQRQEWQAAVDDYRRATSAADDLPAAHFRLACALVNLRQFDAALRSLQRAVLVDPSFPQQPSLLDKIYGPEALAARLNAQSKLVQWSQEDVRDGGRLLLVGALLFHEGDRRSLELLEAAQRFSPRSAYIEAYLLAARNPQAFALPAEPAVAPNKGKAMPDLAPEPARPLPPLPGELAPAPTGVEGTSGEAPNGTLNTLPPAPVPQPRVRRTAPPVPEVPPTPVDGLPAIPESAEVPPLPAPDEGLPALPSSEPAAELPPLPGLP